jgi:Resolvase, N terminal domain
VKVALYARVSTERQQERGTISSQLEALRAAAKADGHQVIDEFVDDGYSGARLDRPALDRLRDAAEAGVLDGVLCLCAAQSLLQLVRGDLGSATAVAERSRRRTRRPRPAFRAARALGDGGEMLGRE